MAATEQNRLAAELKEYALHKNEWLESNAGQYVVIKVYPVLGFYPTFEAALYAGVRTWGANNDFLVKQILEHEPTFSVF